MTGQPDPMPSVEHFFFIEPADRARADRLAADLQRRGHLIDRVRGDVVVSVTSRVMKDNGEADWKALDAIAAAHRVAYDGYGSYVGPIDALGGKG